jgi:hypothetical protein
MMSIVFMIDSQHILLNQIITVLSIDFIMFIINTDQDSILLYL